MVADPGSAAAGDVGCGVVVEVEDVDAVLHFKVKGFSVVVGVFDWVDAVGLTAGDGFDKI